MDPTPGVVVFHHGTTRRRAERILADGPDPAYIEPGGSADDPAGGFSVGIGGKPDIGLSTPDDYARRKANLFPGEGGAVILEVEVPNWIVDIVRGDPDLGQGAESGDTRFEPGVGLEELRHAWPTLNKRILEL